jgi:haloalkane dehalogenase
VRSWPNQRKISVKGIHYPQEEAPDQIGAALPAWLAGLR